MLTKEQSELLAQMRADNQASGPPFRTLGHWEKVGDIFNGWFNEFGIRLDPTSQRYNYHFAGVPSPSERQVMHHWIKYMGGHDVRDDADTVARAATFILHKKIAELDTLGVLDSIMDNPTWGILTAIEILYSIQEHIPILTEPLTLVDLGAGWGRVGYVLRSFNRSARYIIYDLPESLLISLTCLPAMIGDTAHPYNYLSDEPDAYFLGAHKLLELSDKADVFINIVSFQEMEPEYIEAYLDIIDEKAKTLYSMQRNNINLQPKAHWEQLIARRHTLWSNIYYEAMFEL